MTRTWTLAALTLLFSALPHQALAAHHRHRHPPEAPAQIPLDLTPVAVLPYTLPDTTGDPVRANFLRRMNLENGLEVRAARWIRPQDVTCRDLFILDVTQSLEGGFDSVNLYDKGVLSWGIMQWAAAPGSLAPALVYIKRRLLATGQGRVWAKVFAAQGLDADAAGLRAFGKPLRTEEDMRLAFRGSGIVGNYDPKVTAYWATVLARAGRQVPVQRFQAEYAAQAVDRVLSQPLPEVGAHAPGRAATAASLSGHDPYAEALVFALWTNNPRHAREYVADAAGAARAASGASDPTLWAGGAFREALLARCRVSRFGNWRQRAALIDARARTLRTARASDLTPFEQGCQAALAARKLALQKLAAEKSAAEESAAQKLAAQKLAAQKLAAQKLAAHKNRLLLLASRHK